MIYISSSCLKGKNISEVVEQIVQYGFKNIELSGGTKYYENLESDLIELKERYDLNFLIHNYFPPPQEDFVLNLSSTNTEIYNRSIELVQNATDLARKLKVQSIGFHAGFLVEPKVKELGNQFAERSLVPKNYGLEKFTEALNLVYNKQREIKIYIENNVLSRANYAAYKNVNPFLLTNEEDYWELYSKVQFNLLLDVAHLKVSCTTLNRDFESELSNLIVRTDYIHVSDNDGFTDSNKPLKENSEMYEILSRFDLRDKIITLEINQDIDGIIKTHELLNNIKSE